MIALESAYVEVEEGFKDTGQGEAAELSGKLAKLTGRQRSSITKWRMRSG